MDLLEQPLAILQHCLDRRFHEIKLKSRMTNQAEPGVAVAEFVLYLKYDIRQYLFSSDEQLRLLWESIRANEQHVDFLLKLKTEFVARLGREQTLRCCELISDSVSKETTDATLIDEDTYERFPQRSWIYKTLTNNDWLVVVFLLDMLPLKGLMGVINDSILSE